MLFHKQMNQGIVKLKGVFLLFGTKEEAVKVQYL